MKSNYSNTAQLKDLMTVPPMTAAQHAEVMRKRIAHRRMVEEARDLKQASATQFEKREWWMLDQSCCASRFAAGDPHRLGAPVLQHGCAA